MRKDAQAVDIILEGIEKIAGCEVYQMCGWDQETENDFDHPELVVPVKYIVKAEWNRVRIPG